MTSPQPTSSIDPRLTIELNPTSSCVAQSRIAVSRAPDWLTNPTRPGFAIPAAKVAFIPSMGFMTPRQFGPTTRIPYRWAAWSTWRSSSTPSGPTSLNPALMTITPRTPASPHSVMSLGTVFAVVTMTARSTGSPIARTDAYALTQRIAGRVGFTGYTVPPNGFDSRFHRIVRPTLPAFSVAPITAIDEGWKIASSG